MVDKGRIKSVTALRRLHNEAHVMRALHGARIVSCKSAKDRTSMSVTLEQSIWLHEFSGLASHAKSSSTAVMRSHGVRRQNALKNTLKVRCNV